MSFVAPPSPPMDEPRLNSTPSPARKGNRTRNQKNNGRDKNEHQHPQQQSHLSSPNLNSTPPSPMSSKPSHLVDSETVSNASLESSKSSRRRRRARGGGRKNKSKNHIASQQQQPDPLDGNQKNEQQLLDDAEKELYGSERDEEQHPDEGHPGHHHEREKGKEAEQPSGTGIRAFNVRRSDPKGGRPVGMKPQRKSKTQRTATQDHCVHCGQSKQPSSERREPSQSETQQTQETRIPRISLKQNPPRQGPEQEQEGQSAGQEEKQAKDFSIKIDLNLELEIAFKAKVKGEIMLTFLE